MKFEQMIEAMTPEVYSALKRAVELGKWPNGERLSQQQRETCLSAVIAYEHQSHLPDDQRVGYIDRTRPDGTQHGSDPFAPQTLKILTEH